MAAGPVVRRRRDRVKRREKPGDKYVHIHTAHRGTSRDLAHPPPHSPHPSRHPHKTSNPTFRLSSCRSSRWWIRIREINLSRPLALWLDVELLRLPPFTLFALEDNKSSRRANALEPTACGVPTPLVF